MDTGRNDEDDGRKKGAAGSGNRPAAMNYINTGNKFAGDPAIGYRDLYWQTMNAPAVEHRFFRACISAGRCGEPVNGLSACPLCVIAESQAGEKNP
jgi:hypothetical protein